LDAVQSTGRTEGDGGGVGPVARRAVFFSLVWWLLVGGSASGWLFGLAAIPGATAASIRLGPTTPLRLRPVPFLRYLASFLLQSLLGAWDVARRAVHPRLPLAATFIEYPLRLEDETSRVLLAATITMLPGTITAEIRSDRLLIHAIDATRPVVATIRAMETRIGALFGSRLAPHSSSTTRDPHRGGDGP
jgi:multicomponent Na+:H+ antiporter subunit E